MSNIVGRLRQVRGDNEDAREAADMIERLETDYSILKTDYDAQRAEVEHLRTTLGYLADNINEPALVTVAEAALKPKP